MKTVKPRPELNLPPALKKQYDAEMKRLRDAPVKGGVLETMQEWLKKADALEAKYRKLEIKPKPQQS